MLYIYISYTLYMVVDQNSFIREQPFFANKHVAVPSRNLCEKNVTFANSKKNVREGSNITCTAFAIKTPSITIL